LKILLLDIETAPNLAHVWGLWDQNIGLSQLLEPGYTLCWSAKWLDEPEVYIGTIRQGGAPMTREIYKLMSEADAIVHYNGNKFDIPTLNKDFLLMGLPPPPPSKQIDLLRVVKQRFRFPSNKLAHVAERLGLGGKLSHSGHELWLRCMAKDAAGQYSDVDAWKTMLAYNVQDVRLLEKLFHKLRPWIKNMPNYGLERENSLCCPKCGSDTYQSRGFYSSSTCYYKKFQCTKCMGWFRGTQNIGPKPSQKFASL
jgi:hypothetical protein